MRLRARIPLVMMAILPAIVVLPTSDVVADTGPRDYIVILSDSVSIADKVRTEESRGNDVSDVFAGRIKGFVARLDGGDVRRLLRDPQVLVVEPDSVMSVSDRRWQLPATTTTTTSTTVAPVSAKDPVVPAATIGDEIAGEYIVMLRSGVTATDFAATQADGGAQILGTFSTAINGFAARLTKSQLTRLAMDPLVQLVEENAVVGIMADQATPPSLWGLDRIDQRSSVLDEKYTYNFTGAGVSAYIIDTGVRADHLDFGGRVVEGNTQITDGRGTQDCNGHGTHVAGTVGGQTYGVAKEVTIVPIRVLACNGSGSTYDVIAGIEWMINHHAVGVPAVANISIGGRRQSAMNQAVTNAVLDGITVVVAAGNDGRNAADTSPASTPSAVTVGATTVTDARSSFSNFGSILDLFAPGSNIRSAYHTSSSATETLSGTSMAAPHVAGAAALLLQENPSLTPAQVVEELTINATPDVVTNPGTGSPNLLVFSRARWTTPTPELPSAPRSLVAQAGVTQASLSWTTPTQAGRGGVSDYVVEYSANDGSTWTTFADGVSVATSATVTGLTNGVSYSFRVAAVSEGGTGPTSEVVRATIGVPTAPRSLSGTPGVSRANLTWMAPSQTGGSAITDYVVEYKADSDTGWTTFSDGTSTATTAAVTGLTNGVRYSLRVSAVNAVGRGAATAAVNVVPWLAAVPSAPRDLVITDVLQTSIELEWKVPSTDGGATITGYVVEQSTNDGASWTLSTVTTIGTRVGDVRYVTANSLESGREYRFRVRAVNSSGTSEPSAATSPRAPGIPSEPLDAQAVEAGPRRITLRWERPESDGGVALTAYSIDYSVNAGGTWVTWPTSVGVVGCTCQFMSQVVTNLEDGVPHIFRVRAINTVGASQPSDVTTPITPLTPQPPEQPRNLAGTVSAGLLELAWDAPLNDNGAPITDYVVQYSTNGGATWTTFSDGVSTATIASLRSLSVGVAHVFRVSAVNSAGTGSPSTVSESMTPLPPLVNDAFSGAIPIVCGGGCVTGAAVSLPSSTRSASRELGEPSHGGLGASASIWYSFVVDQPGTVTIDTEGSGFDTLLGVYTGTTVDTLSIVTTNDDVSGESTWSRVTLEPQTGVTYLVAIDGYAGRKGSTVLNWRFSGVASAEPPGVPRNVRAVAGDTTASLYWTAPESNGGATITAYSVTAEPGGRGCTSAGALTCAVSGLTNGTAYTFTVVATNRAGDGDPSAASSAVTPSAAPDGGIETSLWGLDRIDQRGLPLNDRVRLPVNGAGVTVYVVDTGVRASHSEFAGRVAEGFSAVDGGNGGLDCNGHGTHVAGVVAGTNFGVAPAAMIVPVRVMDCSGFGSTSDIIAGIDWLITHHLPGVPAVANLSLGGPRSVALDLAVARGVADGITFVVSAGNSNVDACTMSPAAEPSAITVGATTSSDTRWSSSNFGPCLDVFAPGVGIVSAGHSGDSASRTATGTSVAAPHVAGAAALALQRDPSLSPAAVASLIATTATRDVISNPGEGSANRLLYALLEPYTTDGGGGDTGGDSGGDDSDGGSQSPTDPPNVPVVVPSTAPAVTPPAVAVGASRPAVPAPGVRPAKGSPAPALPATVRRASATVRLVGRSLRITVNAPSGSLVHVYRDDRLVTTRTPLKARSFTIPAKGATPEDVVIVIVARSGRVFTGP